MTPQPRKPHISISALGMAEGCGEQYRRRYVLGEKIPPGIALIVGSATHGAINADLTSKKDTGELLPDEQIADEARDAFTHAVERGGILLTDEEAKLGEKQVKADGIDKAVRLSRLHHKQQAPLLQPTHIEREWWLNIDGFPFDVMGYLDIQEGLKALRDTKTSGKTPPTTRVGNLELNAADISDQLTAYVMAIKYADGQLPEKVTLDYLIDTKEPALKVFESTRREEDFMPLLERMFALSRSIEAGVFLPTQPNDWRCNPKWCGYYGTCKFIRRPVSVTVPPLFNIEGAK